MSILLIYKVMINTVQQLNKFAEDRGVKTHGDLLPKLIEHKELVSFEIAKLIHNHQARSVDGLSL